jgi:transcriptional regulator with XRE-family HTH domain
MSDKQTNNFFSLLERNIRQQAKAKGITLSDLVKHIEMTEAGFYKMLSSESIKVKTLRKIAEVLQQPISFFVENNPYTFKKPAQYQPQEDLLEVAEPQAVYQRERENLEKQISILESQLKDKEKIIELLSKR